MMVQSPENNPGQDDGPAVNPVVSPGRMLREARERLGLSVADVADQIKFAPRQIEALEADNFHDLPEMAFVRGFVRSYARILHLDTAALLAALPKTDMAPVQVMPDSVEVPFPDAHLSHRQNMAWLGAAVLLAMLVVGFAVWHFTTPPVQPETAQVEMPVSLPAEMQMIPASPVPATEVIASSAVPMGAQLSGAAQSSEQAAKKTDSPADSPVPQTLSAKPAAQPVTPPSSAELRLVFDEESWVEIKDKDGKMLTSRTYSRGSELRLDGHKPFSLVIGHAAGVRLYYREKLVDLKPYTGVDVARLTLE